METYYSILYLRNNTVSDEKIAIGLFLITPDFTYFDYSKEKLIIASKLVENDVAVSVKTLLSDLYKKINKIRVDSAQGGFSKLSSFNLPYMEYLNRYHNNLLIFSDPKDGVGNFTRSDFSELFKLMVDKSFGENKSRSTSLRSTFKKELYRSDIIDAVDIDYKISSKRLPTIYCDHKLDYVGVNGRIVTGNTLDANSDLHLVENRIYLLQRLATALNSYSAEFTSSDKGRHVVYYNKPETNKHNSVIKGAKKDPTTNLIFVSLEDFEKEKDWILKNNVRKFSELITS